MPNVWSIESTNEDGQRYELNSYPQVQPKIIGPGQYLSLNLTPLLGILNAQKYLPIRYMGGHAARVYAMQRRRSFAPLQRQQEISDREI